MLKRRERKKQLESHLERNEFNSGPIVRIPIIIESGRGDYEVSVERVPKTACKRDEFEELYTNFTDFEIRCEENACLIDVLATIHIYVSVRVSRSFRRCAVLPSYDGAEEQRVRTRDQMTLQTYSVEELERLICECLFWGEKVGKFRINNRDGNEKYVTAESDNYYYSVFYGTS